MESHAGGPHPGGGAQAVRIMRLKRGSQTRCVALQDTISGLMTHWVDGRSQSCRGDSCPKGWHGGETSWRGYFAAVVWDPSARRWEPMVVEVTAPVEQEMRDQFRRGTLWVLSKPSLGRGKGGKLQASLRGAHAFPALPPVFPILDTVRCLYADPELQLDTPNPLPARTYVAPLDLPPPAEDAPPAARPAGERTPTFRETMRRGAAPARPDNGEAGKGG